MKIVFQNPRRKYSGDKNKGKGKERITKGPRVESEKLAMKWPRMSRKISFGKKSQSRGVRSTWKKFFERGEEGGVRQNRFHSRLRH